MKVMKFGGGCVSSAPDLLRLQEIVRAEEKPPVLVVSALGGVTDRLLAGVREARKGEKQAARVVRDLLEKHRDLLLKLTGPGPGRLSAERELNALGQRLGKLLLGIAFTADDFPPLTANLVSFGERFAAVLVAAVLNENEVPARALESDRIGMLTDEVYDNASVNLKRSRPALRRNLNREAECGRVAVVTGFFGRTPGGRVATFGRNGSDYSAAVLAGCLESEVLEIWKDSDGFMSADPRLVGDAVRLDSLSYYEAAELSYFGARILHPRTMEPLLPRSIPVRVKNFRDPESPGTWIGYEAVKREGIIKSVTSNRGVAVLRIEGAGVGCKPGIIGNVGDLLAGAGINIFSIITSQTSINLILAAADAARARNIIDKNRNGVIESIALRPDIVLVAVVGEGLLAEKGVAARVFAAVSGLGVNVEMISAGASDVASYFIVGSRDADRVLKAVHREFFPPVPDLPL